MNHFQYRDGILYAEDVPLTEIARAVGTPFYCYSTATLERHYRVFSQAFADVDAMVCYAMKANSNQAVLKTLGRLGAGVDVVSEGELEIVRELPSGGEELLKTVAAGDYFGEIGPVFHLPRSATARAHTDAAVVGYTVRSFRERLGVGGVRDLIEHRPLVTDDEAD